MGNPVIDVQKLGQSIWYDNIRRGLLTSGELQGMVERDGLLGVTSNPAIFEKAIAGSTDYDAAIGRSSPRVALPRRKSMSASPSKTSSKRRTCCTPCICARMGATAM